MSVLFCPATVIERLFPLLDRLEIIELSSYTIYEKLNIAKYHLIPNLLNDYKVKNIKFTDEAIQNSSAKLIPSNCVIVAMYGATAAKVAINKIPLTTNQACCNLEINPSIALYRYVFHWLSREYLNLKALGQGSQSNINAQIIKNYPIPIPPLSEQQRIVDILDRFDALVNDLSAGLPAEIEARRKQYEYYRDTLLTFKRKAE